MNESIIVFGFPGVGKTYACAHQEELDATIQDSDSSHFHWLYRGENFTDPVLDEDGKKVVHPAWPANYAEYISLTGREQKDPPDFIFVSTHKEVMEALLQLEFKEYWFIVPRKDAKDEYIERYKQRGSSEEFIKKISDNWEKFIDNNINMASTSDFASVCILNSKMPTVYDFIKNYPIRLERGVI